VDWIALHRSDLWQELWKSEEIQQMIETATHMAIHGNFSAEERARIVGRLRALDELPRFVERKAELQLEGETNAAAPHETEIAGVGAVRKLFRRI
jgi:hypothetical protein